MKKKKTIGLALGSGGARGLAHIGVLKVLEENNIRVDYISGTSMGALIGALYASGMSATEIEKEIMKMSKSWKTLFDYNLIPKKGLTKGNKIEEWLDSILRVKTFEELKIPLFVSTLDINSDQEVIFDGGDLMRAVRASISIPGIFTPVSHGERILVDGGLVDPIPSEILSKTGADIIIAVNVNNVIKKEPAIERAVHREVNTKKLPSLIYTLSKSLQLNSSVTSSMDSEKNEIDYAINISLKDVGIFDFSKAEDSIIAGEVATKMSIPEIKRIINPNLIDKLSRYAKIIGNTSSISSVVNQVDNIKKLNYNQV